MHDASVNAHMVGPGKLGREGLPVPFEPLPNSLVEKMAAILQQYRPVDMDSLAADLNALQQEMAEYDASARKAVEEERAPCGPSRKNLAKLYERMEKRLAELNRDIRSLSEVGEIETSVYYRARHQLVARVRQIASRRTRRPKVSPMTLAEMRRQLQLMEEAVESLREDHARDRRGAKPLLLEEEYVLRLEEIFCSPTGEDYAGVGKRSRFTKFATIAFEHNWPAWGRAGGAEKAISRKLEDAKAARRRSWEVGPE